MKNYKPLLCYSLLLTLCLPVFSQQSFDSSYNNAVSVYTNTAGVNMHLYNGSEYIDYDHKIAGSPFFLDTYFVNGSIVYDGILYNNVQFFYDILHDNVVIKNYNNNTPLLLVQEKVSAFDLEGHHFIRIVVDTAVSGIKNSGFYDVLYNGNTKLFAKRKKIVVEKISVQYSESSFGGKEEYYIYKDNVFYQVSDKKSVLNVLKTHKSELTRFMHQNKIKFKQDKEAAMIKMVAYYDRLNNAK
jgi:hypothetical protein